MPARKPRPTSPRIEPVTEPTDLQRELMFGNAASDSLNISATMAHNTRVLKRFSALGGTLLFRGVLPARERELVILRVGANCQSVYEFGQHTLIGRDSGLSDAEITALTQSPEVRDWSEADRDLIALATSSAPTIGSRTPLGTDSPLAGTTRRSSSWSRSLASIGSSRDS